jgi:hypothetical protein
MGRQQSPGRRYLEENIREVMALYTEDWLTIDQIAERFAGQGVTYQMVRLALLAHGVTLRSSAGHPNKRTGPKPPARETVRVRVPLPADLPTDGAVVTLRTLRRDIARLSCEELGELIGLMTSRVAHIERTPIQDLTVGTVGRHVDGCAARLLVVAEFAGAETVVLYDSHRDERLVPQDPSPSLDVPAGSSSSAPRDALEYAVPVAE